MDTEVLLKIVEGSSAITLLAIGILYLLAQRRRRNGNDVDHSKYVTQIEFEATVAESRRINSEKHQELLTAMTVFGKEQAADRQNLFDHVSSHS